MIGGVPKKFCGGRGVTLFLLFLGVCGGGGLGGRL